VEDKTYRQRYYELNKATVDASNRAYGKRYRAELIATVLTHYVLNGKLQCAWPDCAIIDIDMLTLDHINDNGNVERKQGNRTSAWYRKLKAAGFPDGYQTLCANHNLKKHLLRLRRLEGTCQTVETTITAFSSPM